MKWLGPVGVVTLAILAELTLRHVGNAPGFALFFGRFHPLVVHLPIGFFILVALGEAATLRPGLRERVEPALGLLVPLSAVAALGAFLMGQLLALEGGFPAGALGWHRRLTLLAVLGMAGCWVLFERQRGSAGQGRGVYRVVMGATLGVLSLGAHFGGTMTRGESYLSKYAPAPLKPLLGAPEAKPEAAPSAKPAAASEPLVYEHVLQPILTHYCVACHGAEKQKGKLRLDSLEAVQKGGENGPVVVAGNAFKSPLVARVRLPATDDDHMPPEGKPGPTPEELALIEFWIERGASPTLKVRDVLAPVITRSLLEHALGPVAPSDAVPVKSGDATPPQKAAEAAASGSADTTVPSPRASSAAASATAAPPAAREDSAGAFVSEPPAAASPPPSSPVTPAGASSGPGFLAAHCEKCHGAQKQKGKLRVDSVAALLQGGMNGAALVPGHPEQSSIVARVRLAAGDEDHMPPAKEPQPTAAEIAALVAWVRSGAGAGAASAKPTPVAGGAAPAAAARGEPTADASAAPVSATATPSTVATSAAAATPTAAATSPATPADATSRAATPGPLPARVALFPEAVGPLLREKCGKCHVRDKPAGGLSLADAAELVAGGFSGPGLVPKDRHASLIMQRLTLPVTDDEHMPPEGEPALAADEIELVGSWIDQGAPAKGLTRTAALTAGAARALSARGVKGVGPEPPALEARAGGCAACTVLGGAPRSPLLRLQLLALGGLTTLLGARRTFSARARRSADRSRTARR